MSFYNIVVVIDHFYFLLVQRRNSVFVNCNVFLNKYSLLQFYYHSQKDKKNSIIIIINIIITN